MSHDKQQAGKSMPGPRVNILLMTATITPTDSPSLVRTDPAVRLEDYRQALDFYIGHLKRGGRGSSNSVGGARRGCLGRGWGGRRA